MEVSFKLHVFFMIIKKKLNVFCASDLLCLLKLFFIYRHLSKSKIKKVLESHHIYINRRAGDKAEALKTKKLSIKGNKKHGLHHYTQVIPSVSSRSMMPITSNVPSPFSILITLTSIEAANTLQKLRLYANAVPNATLKKLFFCAIHYSFNVFPFQFTLTEAVKVTADVLAYKETLGKEEHASLVYIYLTSSCT